MRYYATNLSAVNKNGIVIRNSDIRALPSAKPYFFNPQKAGEGFPFDYFQESRVYANTMHKAVSEISADGWAGTQIQLIAPTQESWSKKVLSQFQESGNESKSWRV